MGLPAFRCGQRVAVVVDVVVSTVSTAGVGCGFDPPTDGAGAAAFAEVAVFRGVVLAAICMWTDRIPTPSSAAGRVQTQNAAAIQAARCCRRMNRRETPPFSTAVRRSPDPL